MECALVINFDLRESLLDARRVVRTRGWVHAIDLSPSGPPQNCSGCDLVNYLGRSVDLPVC